MDPPLTEGRTDRTAYTALCGSVMRQKYHTTPQELRILLQCESRVLTCLEAKANCNFLKPLEQSSTRHAATRIRVLRLLDTGDSDVATEGPRQYHGVGANWNSV